MAWGAGGLFGTNLGNWMSGVAANQWKLSGGSVDTFNIALYNNSVTPNFYDSDPNSRYNAGQWLSTFEVHSTGAEWPAGGISLVSPGLTFTTSPIKWSASNISIPGTAISNIYGCLIYDATLANKYALIAIPFSGSPYNTNNGTFGITWSASGIWTWATP